MPKTTVRLAIIFLIPWLHHLPAFVAGLLHSQRGKIHRHCRLPTLARSMHVLKAKRTAGDERNQLDSREDTDLMESPYTPLNKFLSALFDYNKSAPGSIHIVPQGSTKLPPCQDVESHAFTTDIDCIIAITAAGSLVEKSKIEAALSRAVDSPGLEEVPSLCGFPTGNIPPVGHSSSKSIVVLVDSILMEKCKAEGKMLLCGGGHAYWRSLVSPDFLLTVDNVRVAAIADVDSVEKAASLRPAPSLLSTLSSSDAANPIPIEEIEAPPIHIAEIVMQQRELSNPLTPSLVSVTGRVGKIESRRKQLVSCELLPLITEEKDESDQMPWKSRDGIDMTVSLVFGKVLLRQFGKIRGLAAIESIQEGMNIQVQAKTNVGNRDSLGKWLDSRTLELVVFDYQILLGDNPESKPLPVAEGYKHRPQPNMVAESPGMPELAMSDIFSEGSVHMVDSIDSLESFSKDYKTILSQLVGSHSSEKDGSRDRQSCSNLVGIDCEWQPHQFMAERQPQPVLLMQVSLHALEKVYLFDFQTMLRPLVPKETYMNRLEEALSETLDDLFTSTVVFKTGYQLMSDLRRIAASYPHIPCFREVHSVLEVSGLIKRILHITKQKKSRGITISLARMAEHYVGRTVNKGCQVSDWSVRPIEPEQRDYAALDAAISPKLVEKALDSVDASIDTSVPVLRRWDGDESLAKLLDSWRFMIRETQDDTWIQEVQAKQIVGPSWVVTQNWITGRTEPERVACE